MAASHMDLNLTARVEGAGEYSVELSVVSRLNFGALALPKALKISDWPRFKRGGLLGGFFPVSAGGDSLVDAFGGG
jgi:hypothetical protein